MQQYKLCVLLCISFCLGMKGLYAQDVQVWTVPKILKDSLDISSYLGIYEDESKDRTWAEVKQAFFRPLLPTDTVGPNFPKWLRLDIQNPNDLQDTLWLFVGHHDKIAIYEESNTPIAMAGYLVHFSELADAQDRLFLPLPLSKATHTFYIQTEIEFRDWEHAITPFVVSNEQRLVRLRSKQIYSQRFFIIVGVFLGEILIFLIFSIYQYAWYRDKAYLYYALYLTGLIFYYLRIFEARTTSSFLFSEFIEYYNYFEAPLGLLAITAYVSFGKHFLNIKQVDYTLNKWFNNSIYILLAYIFIDIIIKLIWGLGMSLWWYFFIRTILIFWAIFVVHQMYLKRAKINNVYLNYLIIGSMILLVVGLISIFMFFVETDYSPHSFNDIVSNSRDRLTDIPIMYMLVGILAEVVIFSLGLGYRNKIVRDERETVLAEKIETQTQLAETETQRLHTQKELEDAKLKLLKFQLKPHVIFNFLNSIIQLIKTKKNDLAEKNLIGFSKYLRMILEFMESNRITLKDELSLSKKYVAAEQLRFEDFHFDIYGEDVVDLDDILLPPLSLQPYLENAINHGLRPKIGEKNLTISFSLIDEHLCCSIDDNGIGREKARERAAIHSGTHNGIAMNITKKRLDEEKIRVEIVDKSNNDDQTEGTQINLYIPYTPHT